MFAILIVLHAYVAARLLPPLGLAGALAGGLALAVSAYAIPRGFRARRARAGSGGLLMWTGLVALGAFSTLVVLTLARDAALAVLLAIAAVADAALPIDAVARDSALAVIALTGLVTVFGWRNARRVARVRHVNVPIESLPAALQGFTIAQLTDLHVGPTIGRDHIDAIVDAVNALDADAIAITGDLVDGSVRQLADQVEPLARLASRHGTFFVTGNHEYYSGAHAWVAELRRLGLKVLLNEHVVIERDDAALVIGGVTDFSAHHFIGAHRSDPHTAIAGAPVDAAAKVLLAHQPRSASAAAAAGFDLQLSGHTHGGQFLPWNFFVRFQQPFTAGLHRLGRLWVYTSRGTGYWGPPKRFGAPSEITCVRLVRG